MFQDWLVAIGFPDADDFRVRKAALLRASLGAEGSRIYYSYSANSLTDTYDAVVQIMDRHFGTASGVIYNRAQFTRCMQRSGEPLVQFLAELRELARKGEFPDAQFDERVRDQFAVGVADVRIRERLLQEPGDKTLNDLVTLSRTMERALTEAPALASGRNDSAVMSVDRSRDHPRDRRRSSDRNWKRSPSMTSSKPAGGCRNCGRNGHSARDPDCPANESTCKNCGKKGHWDVKCRSKKSTSDRYRRPKSKRQQVHVVDTESDDDVIVSTVLTTQTGQGKLKLVASVVNGRPIGLVVDLGSKVSILSKRFYDSAMTSLPLQPPDIVLRAYGGPVIPCVGMVRASVRVENLHLSEFNFYITTSGPSLMGVDLFDALGGSASVAGLVLANQSASAQSVASVAAQSMTSSTPSSVRLEDYPVLLKAGGRLKGFKHRPLIDKTVKPVRQKFWHPPLAKRKAIEDEIHRLEADDVIEKVDASEWLSNLVTAKKRDGSLRLCVHLKDVNRAVIPDSFPLPTMDELTACVAGSTVFTKLDLLWGYLQLKLAEDRRNLTAFISHIGIYRYKSLPFVLSSGPSAYQKVIRKIL